MNNKAGKAIFLIIVVVALAIAATKQSNETIQAQDYGYWDYIGYKSDKKQIDKPSKLTEKICEASTKSGWCPGSMDQICNEKTSCYKVLAEQEQDQDQNIKICHKLARAVIGEDSDSSSNPIMAHREIINDHSYTALSNCIKKIALNKNDPSLCDQIRSEDVEIGEEYRYACYVRFDDFITSDKNSIEYCKQIEDSGWGYHCYENASKKEWESLNINVEYCQKIKDNRWRHHCYENIEEKEWETSGSSIAKKAQDNIIEAIRECKTLSFVRNKMRCFSDSSDIWIGKYRKVNINDELEEKLKICTNDPNENMWLACMHGNSAPLNLMIRYPSYAKHAGYGDIHAGFLKVISENPERTELYCSIRRPNLGNGSKIWKKHCSIDKYKKRDNKWYWKELDKELSVDFK